MIYLYGYSNIYIYTVHYASQNVEEIIEEIKKNPRINWDKTIIIITSDNGGSQNGASTMPLRGSKS